MLVEDETWLLSSTLGSLCVSLFVNEQQGLRYTVRIQSTKPDEKRSARNSPSTFIRAANPTSEEGLAFAHYLDEAFEGLFRAALGRNAACIVATAYMQPDHDFSYLNTIFAERDTTIVGMAAGYTAEQHRRFSDQALKQAAGNSIFQKVGVNLLCLRLRFLGTHIDGDFYLQAIAVDREFRGQRIGTTLMEAIEERARTSGSTRLFLDVAARNRGAQRLYERHGMVVEPKKRVIPFPPRFVVQMTKGLWKVNADYCSYVLPNQRMHWTAATPQ